jgi:pimeloyl-ACP methyl ester carboxylesterase
MEDYFTAAINWVSSNESLLSGLVAIAILSSLAFAGVRKLGSKSRVAEGAASEASQPDTTLEHPAPDQDIRYCQTSDGKRIAYAVMGEGTPIVRVLGWFTHLEAEWSSPIGRGFWQRLARQHELIRYDGRGMGLSEASVEFSAETRMRDLEAVIDAAGLDKFALVALSEGTRTAVRYAVKNPERVTHLVLYGSALIKNERRDEENVRNFTANRAMIEVGWGKETHRKFFSDLFLGRGASPEEIDYFTEIQKCSADREVALTYFESIAEKDQGFEMAAQISVPTLVMHKKNDQMTPFQWGRDLAAQIPGAVFKPVEGDDHFLMLNSERIRSNECIGMIESFLET